MVRPKRLIGQTDLQTAIKETAWKQIAEFGAPMLSLRAIARELNITAPAIYNYFQRRDDLVTALVIDAYTSFGDSQLAARDSLAESDLFGRMTAIGLAYRQWALTYPQRYLLIFGTSIPGYEPPIEQINPSAARSLSALTTTVEAFHAAGRLRVDSLPQVQSQFAEYAKAWCNYTGNVSIQSLTISLFVWARVHGLVSLELNRSMPPFGPNGDGLYLYELSLLQKEFFTQ